MVEDMVEWVECVGRAVLMVDGGENSYVSEVVNGVCVCV